MLRRWRMPQLLLVLLLLTVTSLASARPVADSAILFIGDGMGFNHVRMTQGVDGKPLQCNRCLLPLW